MAVSGCLPNLMDYIHIAGDVSTLQNTHVDRQGSSS
jgi:hypothetical protein